MIIYAYDTVFFRMLINRKNHISSVCIACDGAGHLYYQNCMSSKQSVIIIHKKKNVTFPSGEYFVYPLLTS
jgi:hypothetical protein